MSQEDQMDFARDSVPDEDTQKLLDEIKAEETSTEETKEKAEEKVEKTETEEKVEEKSEDESEDETEETETKETKTERTPRMVEAYKMKIAEKQFAKREAELLGQIESLKNQPPSQETPKPSQVNIDKVSGLADKYGVDKDLVKELVELAGERQIPENIIKATQELEQIKKERQQELEDKQFENEFKSLETSIKGEFPNITEGELANVKARLNKLAFSEEYNTVPLSFIYKGIDDFRKASVPRKKTAETSSTGKDETIKGQKNYSEWGEEDIEKASAEEFDKYSKWADKQGNA